MAFELRLLQSWRERLCYLVQTTGKLLSGASQKNQFQRPMSLKVNSCICKTACFPNVRDCSNKAVTGYQMHAFPGARTVSSFYHTSLFACTFYFHKPWDITDYRLYPKIVLLCTSFINSEENSTSSRPWVMFFFTPEKWKNGMYTGSQVVGSSPERWSLESNPNLLSFQENIRPEISQEWTGSGDFWQFLLLTPPRAVKQPQKQIQSFSQYFSESRSV